MLVCHDRPSRSTPCIYSAELRSQSFRFLADKYKIDMSSASNTNNLSNAIKRGHEKGDLNLPKGIGGRVKLPAKVSPHAFGAKTAVNIDTEDRCDHQHIYRQRECRTEEGRSRSRKEGSTCEEDRRSSPR